MGEVNYLTMKCILVYFSSENIRKIHFKTKAVVGGTAGTAMVLPLFRPNMGRTIFFFQCVSCNEIVCDRFQVKGVCFVLEHM